MIINLANTLTKVNGSQQTYAASFNYKGSTNIPVKNIGGFTTNWAVQLGQTGEETAEIMLITPSGTVLSFGTSPSHTAGTSLYDHAQDTPIYQIHYDQVVFYRATAGTAGPFSALATISIQPDNLYTQYDDTTGAATYAYYGRYYNSVTGDLSGSSSIFVPGGPTFYSLQKIKDRIKAKLYSAGYIKFDDNITDWINEWYELMTNAAIKVNQGYMLGTAAFSFDSNGLGTVTDTRFKQPVKFEVTYDSGATYIPSTQIAVREYTESDWFTAYNPRHSWIGETVFEILPHDLAGSAKITYAQRFTPLTNDSDEVTQTLKAYTTSCVEYCLSVAYGLDLKDPQQQEHYQKFLKYQQDFVAEVTPRDVTSVELIDLPESISGLEENYIF